MKTYSYRSLLSQAILTAMAALVVGTAASAHAALTLPAAGMAGPLVKAGALSGALLRGSEHLMQPLSAVPEPSTWAVMVIGVAALALVLRRRARLS